MNTVRMKRITIIGGESVRYRIVKEIKGLGATGYEGSDFSE